MTFKKYIFVFLMILVCHVQAKNPRWINDPQGYCKKSELCAVGEGVNQSRAKRAARLAIAKIFKTQVKSKYSESISAANGERPDEFVSEDIEENTDVSLEGVTIKKVHETDIGFYALAALNKRKAANKIKKEIEGIDKQMQALATSGKPSSWMKIEPLFYKREALNDRHIFLSGFDISRPLSYAEVFKYKNKAAQKMRVFVTLKEDDPRQVEPLLKQVLSDRGYKTVSGANGRAQSTHTVRGQYSYEKQYLKVNGFEKYKFMLEVSAMNKKKVESGKLTTSVVTTGRDFSQAKEKALEQIQEYLIENIEKLNIE